jgi:hypothetical protein
MLGTAITRGVLGGVLLAVLSSLPLVAEDATVERDDGPLTMAVASVAALARAVRTAPSLVWPDAPAPASVAPYLPAVREQLQGSAFEQLIWPLYPRFLEARCNEHGAVALVFEELRPLVPWRTYALAWRAAMPTSPQDEWAQVSGLTSPPADPDLVRLVVEDTLACP